MGIIRPKAGTGDAPRSESIVTPSFTTTPGPAPIALYLTEGLKYEAPKSIHPVKKLIPAGLVKTEAASSGTPTLTPPMES